MRDEELQAAIEDARGADDRALAHEGAAEGDRRRHAGQEHEHVGGVADAEARGNEFQR